MRPAGTFKLAAAVRGIQKSSDQDTSLPVSWQIPPCSAFYSKVTTLRRDRNDNIRPRLLLLARRSLSVSIRIAEQSAI